MAFKQISPHVDFPSLEEEMLSRWIRSDTFKKSVTNRKGNQPFVFFEGPPTANGKPGSHHVEARVFKDLIPRYKTMRGYYCERKGGWDCHGLPVELEIEKKLKISGKPEIEKYGVEKFNLLCKKSVFEYVDEWEKLTQRIGFWIDTQEAYETMSNKYIETCWWILKEAWSKGRLYEDYKVLPYCPRCGTSLSSHELALGYKDNVPDTSVYVKFKLRDAEATYLLAWTTTPWTLPGNVALAVDPDAEYVQVEVQNEIYIVARSRLSVLDQEFKEKRSFKGSELLGKSYEPLYSYVKYDQKAHYIIPANFVSLDEGTGIVHTAVMYGEEDFQLGKKYDLPRKHAVNEKGEFIADITPWAGKFVKDADPLIVDDLKKSGKLFRSENILHTYPFCWRCGTPLLYYALTSWYLKTTAVKSRLLTNNQSVNWIPAHIKNGRMGEWLNSNRDWALSRSRYWGTPLPIWCCDKCGEIAVVGSVSELSQLSGKDQSQLDLHRPYVDEITWKCKNCPGMMKRLSFVLDCWFDSGSMPYAQWHYPFENKLAFESHFPADYICEAIDQARGWFYTLQAVSSLLDKESPYKNVICLGLALDENGNKMSKSKGNVVNPWDVINETGVDAMRWYFYSVINPGESFRFSANLVKEVNRRFLLILWNVYNFFVTFANLDKYNPKLKITIPSVKNLKLKILDKWILARLNLLVAAVTTRLDGYDIYSSTSEIELFVSDLSTWYIRRSRDRVGLTTRNAEDKNVFYATCYQVLTTLTKLLAPFIPFVSDAIFTNLTGKSSVHLSNWPKAKKLSKSDTQLTGDMKLVRKIVELGLSERKKYDIRVRQPLRTLRISAQCSVLSAQLLQLLKDELNIKEITWSKGELSVDLDLKLDAELLAEGRFRDLIRQIQEKRKELGARLDQKIKLVVPNLPVIPKLLEDLKRQTLAKEVKSGHELQVELL